MTPMFHWGPEREGCRAAGLQGWRVTAGVWMVVRPTFGCVVPLQHGMNVDRQAY